MRAALLIAVYCALCTGAVQEAVYEPCKGVDPANEHLVMGGGGEQWGETGRRPRFWDVFAGTMHPACRPPRRGGGRPRVFRPAQPAVPGAMKNGRMLLDSVSIASTAADHAFPDRHSCLHSHHTIGLHSETHSFDTDSPPAGSTSPTGCPCLAAAPQCTRLRPRPLA